LSPTTSKPGIQAIATTSLDLPPVPGTCATFSRDHEYERPRSACWPGLICSPARSPPGQGPPPQPRVHRVPQASQCCLLLNAAYQAVTAIRLILDNHSAHISKETRAWLATQPAGRFAFTFTPKHGSWLNLVEGFFSKFARSVLRHIRVASKQELKERIMLGIRDVNRYPVIHTRSYKLAETA
jgi:DDE superfamily endonuclease